MERKLRIGGLLYALVLTLFTVYVLLDTFVITRVEMQVPSTPQISTTPTNVPNEGPVIPDEGPDTPKITDRTYRDRNISITLTEYREHDTDIYVAEIKIASADYLKTAFAKNAYGRNIKETTSDMAENNGAILAINGDYYGSRQKGYVLRNGILYRMDGDPKRQDLMIGKDGDFRIYSEANVSANMLSSFDAWQVFSFGPALLQEGQISVDKNAEVDQATTSNPRTAIAQVGELHYLMVVSDGRTDRSEGLSLYQLATFLQTLGARTAYNLDGGGSSTMWFNGNVINQPVNHGSEVSERKVSDIVYIGY
ncbi:MAG: phosphodiester glycosidase family protein [Oscillospiraceae bacterium]|nr:phosphodiester glycosidase family protein [Oscillospiraceae bacterium]